MHSLFIYLLICLLFSSRYSVRHDGETFELTVILIEERRYLVPERTLWRHGFQGDTVDETATTRRDGWSRGNQTPSVSHQRLHDRCFRRCVQPSLRSFRRPRSIRRGRVWVLIEVPPSSREWSLVGVLGSFFLGQVTVSLVVETVLPKKKRDT